MAKPSPAQSAILRHAERGFISRSLYSPVRWYDDSEWPARTVTSTAESLIKRGLAEVGPFVALGKPRILTLTAAGHAALAEVTQ